MALRGGCLAIDLSTRNLGWACDGRGNAPVYDRVLLPGMGPRDAPELGRLYCAVRNVLADLFEELQPARMLFCLARFHDMQTTARALNGVQAVAEMAAYDNEVQPYEAIESKARKAVTGKGSFGGKDEFGRLIEGKGRKDAKAWVAKWCDRMGYAPQSDDVADALVLWHYDVLERKLRR